MCLNCDCVFESVFRRVVTDDNIPPKAVDQMQLLSAHGIFVTPLGAAGMNAMFLVPHSSVIEIFPPNIDNNFVSTLSIMSGLGYYPVHTYNATLLYSQHKVTLARTLLAISLEFIVSE